MLKVLLVDDNTGNLFLNARTLKQLGCEVTEVDDPVKGLQLLNEATSYDVAFVDLYMPKMNGYHFLEQAKLINPDLPIVITSVVAHPQGEMIALSKGAAAYMSEKQELQDFALVLQKLFPEWA